MIKTKNKLKIANQFRAYILDIIYQNKTAKYVNLKCTYLTERVVVIVVVVVVSVAPESAHR